MKIDQSLFDKEEFNQWLEGKPDHSIVGHAMNGCLCPIANWIASKGLRPDIFGLYALITDGSVPMFSSKEYEIDLPLWAVQFIDAVDTEAKSKSRRGTLNYSDVTKEEALKALA